ncbi:MAG TPA: Xaa-Pro peptidase family protein [Candidatus Hydrogenedens sp.]|nr:Xaa-Pro peptidase family protein [Candidatus Hydrogenedens sp.]
MSDENIYLKRINQIRDILRQCSCDAFLSFCPIETRYFSGFTGSDSAILITQTDRYFISDPRYDEQARNEVFNFSIRIIQGNIEKEVFNIINMLNFKKIGVNPERINLESAEKLQQNSPVELVSLKDELYELRMVKDLTEIEKIRTACKITEKSVYDCLRFLKKGVTEREIAARIDYEFRLNGADGSAFDTIVLFGKNTSLPHGKPTDRKLNKDDIILIDCGCIYKGYCSDLTRTFFCGVERDTQILDIYDTVLSAQLKALSALGPGVKTNDVDNVAREIISSKGFGDYFGHGLGHGVGLEIHELPRLNKDSDYILREGNVVTVEPGIYIANKGGVRIEDTVLITSNGYERLTVSDKNRLFIILPP